MNELFSKILVIITQKGTPRSPNTKRVRYDAFEKVKIIFSIFLKIYINIDLINVINYFIILNSDVLCN